MTYVPSLPPRSPRTQSHSGTLAVLKKIYRRCQRLWDNPAENLIGIAKHLLELCFAILFDLLGVFTAFFRNPQLAAVNFVIYWCLLYLGPMILAGMLAKFEPTRHHMFVLNEAYMKLFGPYYSQFSPIVLVIALIGGILSSGLSFCWKIVRNDLVGVVHGSVDNFEYGAQGV